MKMTSPFASEVNSPRREALAFFVLTVAVSWLFWFPGVILVNVAPSALGDFILAVGSFVPLGVAIFLDIWLNRRSFRPREWRATTRLSNILMALLLPACWFAPAFLSASVQGTVQFGGLVEALLGSLPWSLGLLLIGFGEEAGWRGYLLPRLADSATFLVNLLVGVLWFIWLLPLVLFLPPIYFPGSGGGFVAFFLFSLLVTPFFNRLAYRTRNNVVLPALARGALGITVGILGTTLVGLDTAQPIGLLVMSWLLLLNVLLFSQLWLGRKPPSEISELERVMPLQASQ